MSGIAAGLYGIVAIVTLVFAFWAVMLIDCLKRPNDRFHTEMKNAKSMWTKLLIVGVPWCGIVYFVSVKNKD
ncbi:MAG: hypothetical protein KAT13_00380 [Methanosarcinales archaeon]|nr:hypothetical protein [Methanosarcinales archaeon]